MQILLQSEANVITKWGSFFALQSGAKDITKKGAGIADITKRGNFY